MPMAIYEHIAEFAGKRVLDWEPGAPASDPAQVGYRISLSWNEANEGVRWVDKFARFLADPVSGRATGLVVGPWEELPPGDAQITRGIVEAIAAAHDRLPALNALFLGEIISEESEISWIEQCDVTPVLDAYPRLEHFAVRGGNGLRLPALRHDTLRTLVVQAGGLPRQVVQDVSAAHLPALRHLELWLGIENYGGDTTVADLAPLLSGRLFPNLEYLGLRDSEIADEIASAVAAAPVLEGLGVLDLSLGALTDVGAAALLASPAVAKLRKLDLHYHFCSPAMVERLTGLPIEVDASEPQEPDAYGGETYRYVAVSE
jgi:hypothetical protein